MQIKVETLSPVKKKINFEIPAERVTDEINKAIEAIRSRATVKGFRKGKAPMSVIEKQYGAVMAEDVMKALFNDTYFKALTDHNINPVAFPAIETAELKKGESFSYSATVEVFPDVVVNDYEAIEVQKERYVADAETVDRRIAEMRESLAQLKPVEAGHAVENGDFITIDFKGYMDGVPFDGGEGSDFVLEIGSGRFIPGFEDQVCGMQAGEQREIRVVFPEDYGKQELAGKEAVFDLTVKEIKVKELPPLDDDLAAQFGDFENLDQLRAKLTEMHEKQETDRIESDVRERLVKALIEKNEFVVPDALVDRQLESMLENAKKRLAYQRMTLEMMGMNDAAYKAQFRGTAEMQVKGSLLLDALATREGIEVDEIAIEERIKQIAAQNPESFESVNSYYRSNERAIENLKAQIREDKAIELISSKAKITEVDRSELA